MSTRFGMRLKKLRQGRELTQADLGRKTGVTEAYISMLESGAKKNPSLPLVKRLAKVLGVPVGKLLE